jgi:hypothetical protein
MLGFGNVPGVDSREIGHHRHRFSAGTGAYAIADRVLSDGIHLLRGDGRYDGADDGNGDADRDAA